MTSETPDSQRSLVAITKALETLRGLMSTNESVLLVGALVVLKFLSDLKRDESLDHKRWLPAWREVDLPAECDWMALRLHELGFTLPRTLDEAFQTLSDKSVSVLHDAFREIRIRKFDQGANSPSMLLRVFDLLTHTDLRPSALGGVEEVGNLFERFLRRTEREGRTPGEFLVPQAVAALLAKLLETKVSEAVMDPFCGSGLLLSHLASHIEAGHHGMVYGQDPREGSMSLCKMNLFLHGISKTHIEKGDCLVNPLRDTTGNLLKADVVVSNPPFAWRNWNGKEIRYIRPSLFESGLNPQGGSEYAYLSHMLEVTRRDGRVGIIVSTGALFRQEEKDFRRHLVENGLISTVVLLPANLFQSTSVPVALILAEKSGSNKEVLFVDSSHEFDREGSLNRLSDVHVENIVRACRSRLEMPGFSRAVTLEEIRLRNFSLAVSLYIERAELEESPRTLEELYSEIGVIEEELAEVRSELDKLLHHNRPGNL